jgi:hypothetical protein
LVAASQNGDVNGDGLFDITDSLYMLFYLFGEGDPPVACAQAVPTDLRALTMAVERIADATEVGVNQNERVCDSLDRFQDNGDGTATDRCLNIMWSLSTTGLDISLPEAPAWLSSNDFGGGYDDWRLPTIQELLSLEPLFEKFGYAPPIPIVGSRTMSQTVFPSRTDKVWMAQIVYENPPSLHATVGDFTEQNVFTVAVRDITE